MKKITCLLLLLFCTFSINAIEPGNNLGKSLFQMKQDFPGLRYVGQDENGDKYEDGCPQDEIASFFIFKNNYLIEECLICQTNDGFPHMWFSSMVESFNKKWHSALKVNKEYHKKYVFSYFTIDLIYVTENGDNTALIVYKIL